MMMTMMYLDASLRALHVIASGRPRGRASLTSPPPPDLTCYFYSDHRHNDMCS